MTDVLLRKDAFHAPWRFITICKGRFYVVITVHFDNTQQLNQQMHFIS